MSSATLKRVRSEADFSDFQQKKQKDNEGIAIMKKRNKKNKKSKKKQKSNKKTIDQKKKGGCRQCGAFNTNNNDDRNKLLDVKATKNNPNRWCVGCKRFFTGCKGKEEQAKLLVRAGVWPERETRPDLTDEELLERFRRKANTVNNRSSTAIPDWSPEVTGEQLFELYQRHDRRCQFFGIKAYVHTSRGAVPYWAVSIDHIKPVNSDTDTNSSTDRDRYRLENLQIMLSVFNHVKGNYKDENLRECFHCFQTLALYITHSITFELYLDIITNNNFIV